MDCGRRVRCPVCPVAAEVMAFVLRGVPLRLRECGILSDVFLFNEHFIVKCPGQVDQFAWHRDEDEQLKMAAAVPGALSGRDARRWLPPLTVD